MCRIPFPCANDIHHSWQSPTWFFIRCKSSFDYSSSGFISAAHEGTELASGVTQRRKAWRDAVRRITSDWSTAALLRWDTWLRKSRTLFREAETSCIPCSVISVPEVWRMIFVCVLIEDVCFQLWLAALVSGSCILWICSCHGGQIPRLIYDETVENLQLWSVEV